MRRTAVITQPTYLPWLGYFEQIAQADVFVILDTVQFEKQSWQCRNRLKGSNGEPFWLTVPLAQHPLDTPLHQIRIAPNARKWADKHLRSMTVGLGRAAAFREVYPLIAEWMSAPYEYLVDLNIAGIRLFSQMLGLAPEIIRASDLQPRGQKAELVVDLCRQVNATRYYAAAGSREYLDEQPQLFSDAGIALEYQGWPHPTYPQQGPGFVSHLAVPDALMNLGPVATRALLTQPVAP